MALGESYSNVLLVTVDGVALPDDVQVTRWFVDTSLIVPDVFELRFLAGAADVLLKTNLAIGAKVELVLQSSQPAGPQHLLTGEVTALEAELDTDGFFTVVRGMDLSHRLFRGTRVVSYHTKASTVVETVARRAGIPAKVTPTSDAAGHIAQAGVSDWQFLKDLARRHHRVLTMSPQGVLEFVAPDSASKAPSGSAGARDNAMVLQRHVNLLRLRATVTAANQVPEVEVRGWDPGEKKEVVASLKATTEAAVPDDGLTPSSLGETFKSPPYVRGCASLSTKADVDAVASSLADRIAGGFVEVTGVAIGNPALRAGVSVRLMDVGAHFNGKVVLTSTRHEESSGKYQTSFTASNQTDRSLFASPAAGGREQAQNWGVVPAVISSIKDDQKLGRVKLRFPWLSDDYESDWVRVVHPGAGKDRGLSILPERGDEVLVAFEHGDFGHPYVLGGLYGKDEPFGGWGGTTDAISGEVTKRSWTSRTGMKIEFTEGPADAKVEVSTSDAQKITLTQTGSKGIAITSDGALSLEAKGDIKLSGTNVVIDAKVSAEVNGVNVKAAGKAAVDIRGALVKING